MIRMTEKIYTTLQRWEVMRANSRLLKAKMTLVTAGVGANQDWFRNKTQKILLIGKVVGYSHYRMCQVRPRH